MPEQWHYSKGDQRLGPVTTEELKAMAGDGRLSPDDMIWKKGMPEWAPASSAKGLFLVDDGPPPLPPGPAEKPISRTRRSQSRQPQGSGLPTWAKVAGVAAAIAVGLVAYQLGQGSGGGRQSGPQGGTQLTASSVEGYWLNYEAEPDGTATRLVVAYLPGGRFRVLSELESGGQIVASKGNQGTWTLHGEMITMATEKGTSTVKVRMLGPDQMAHMQGQMLTTFERVPNDAGELKFSMAAQALNAAPQPSPQPSAGGSRPQELVGKWHVPRMKGADGRDVGGITMVLARDGPFELTIPVGVVDGQETGGTSSGTWSVAGNSLVLAMSDGGPPVNLGIENATQDFLLLVVNAEGDVWPMKRMQ